MNNLHLLQSCRFFSAIFLQTLTLLLSQNTFAETTRINCASTIFEPFVIEKNGVISGIDIDTVNLIGSKVGLSIDFVLMPWKRLERDVELGKIDCVAAYFRTPKRETYMDFMNVPLHITEYTLFMLADNKIPSYTSLKQLQGKIVGVRRGFKTTLEFESAINKGWFKIWELDDDKQGLGLLQPDRIQAYLTNKHVGEYLVKKHNYQNVVPVLPSISSTPAYLVFSKNRKLSPLIPKFDAALRELLQDGSYADIVKRYLD